jgi:hypothetical protein
LVQFINAKRRLDAKSPACKIISGMRGSLSTEGEGRVVRNSKRSMYVRYKLDDKENVDFGIIS